MELVTAAEMRELDRAAIETRNIPSLRLMENAGKAVVQEMERFFGPLRGLSATAITLMNASRKPIVAIDLPSGLDGDTGAVLGTAITATLTVTLARPKRGLYLGAGPDHAGAIRVVDIGIPPDIIGAAKIPVTLLEAADIRSWLPVRPR